MKTLSLIALLALALPCRGNAKDCIKKFPKIRKTFEALAPLQSAGTQTFNQLVQKMKAAEEVANSDKERDALQATGCGGESTDALDECVKPLRWSCEGIAFDRPSMLAGNLDGVRGDKRLICLNLTFAPDALGMTIIEALENHLDQLREKEPNVGFAIKLTGTEDSSYKKGPGIPASYHVEKIELVNKGVMKN